MINAKKNTILHLIYNTIIKIKLLNVYIIYQS